MNISNLDVRSMLPENLNHFFRYQGSLTTPPCYESILWTVFDTPITLSHNQVRPTREPSAPKLFFSRTLMFFKNKVIRLSPKWKTVEGNWFLLNLFCCCATNLSALLLRSDQETGEHTDGHGQQDPLE